MVLPLVMGDNFDTGATVFIIHTANGSQSPVLNCCCCTLVDTPEGRTLFLFLSKEAPFKFQFPAAKVGGENAMNTNENDDD